MAQLHERRCPSCNAQNPSDAIFCQGCGKPLPAQPNAQPNNAALQPHPVLVARPQNPPVTPQPQRRGLSGGTIALIIALCAVTTIAVVLTIVLLLRNSSSSSPDFSASMSEETEKKRESLEDSQITFTPREDDEVEEKQPKEQPKAEEAPPREEVEEAKPEEETDEPADDNNATALERDTEGVSSHLFTGHMDGIGSMRLQLTNNNGSISGTFYDSSTPEGARLNGEINGNRMTLAAPYGSFRGELRNGRYVGTFASDNGKSYRFNLREAH